MAWANAPATIGWSFLGGGGRGQCLGLLRGFPPKYTRCHGIGNSSASRRPRSRAPRRACRARSSKSFGNPAGFVPNILATVQLKKELQDDEAMMAKYRQQIEHAFELADFHAQRPDVKAASLVKEFVVEFKAADANAAKFKQIIEIASGHLVDLEARMSQQRRYLPPDEALGWVSFPRIVPDEFWSPTRPFQAPMTTPMVQSSSH